MARTCGGGVVRGADRWHTGNIATVTLPTFPHMDIRRSTSATADGLYIGHRRRALYRPSPTGSISAIADGLYIGRRRRHVCYRPSPTACLLHGCRHAGARRLTRPSGREPSSGHGSPTWPKTPWPHTRLRTWVCLCWLGYRGGSVAFVADRAHGCIAGYFDSPHDLAHPSPVRPAPFLKKTAPPRFVVARESDA